MGLRWVLPRQRAGSSHALVFDTICTRFVVSSSPPYCPLCTERPSSMSGRLDLGRFIARRQVRDLYRACRRAVRRCPDPGVRAQLTDTIRSEFNMSSHIEDPVQIRYLISNGHHRLRYLDDLIALSSSSSSNWS